MNNWGVRWKGHPATIRGEEKTAKVGSVVEAKVQGYTPITLNPIARITEIMTDKCIREEWFDGDLIGIGEWTLEPMQGHTLVRFHMKVRSNRFLVTLFTKIMDRKTSFSKDHAINIRRITELFKTIMHR